MIPASTGEPRRGFALVVALLLLALVVGLALAVSALTSQRVAATADEQGLAEARELARAALERALGQLQAAAGADRRVTATGGLAGKRNRFWTGVWDAADTSRPPVWLVSGEPADADVAVITSGSGANGVWLVGEHTVGADASLHVAVPWEEVTVAGVAGDARDVTIGRIAWWTGDEGVKANVMAVDRVATVAIGRDPGDPVRSTEERERLRQLAAHRAGNELIPGFALGDETSDGDRWAALSRAIDRSQLAFGFASNAAQRAALRGSYHALTTVSRGVPASTAGGLRENLSDRAENARLGGARIAVNDLEENLAGPGPRLALAAGAAPRHGRTAQVKPIITEWALDLLPHRSPDTGSIGVSCRLQLELWNPYPIPLGDGPGADFAVSFDRLPVIEVAGAGRADLAAVIREIPVDWGGDLEPGRVRVVPATTVVFAETGLVLPDLTPANGADNWLDYRWEGMDEGRLTVRVTGAGRPGDVFLELVDAPAPFPRGSWRRLAPWSVDADGPFPSGDPARYMPAAGTRVAGRLTPARPLWRHWVEPAGGRTPRDLRHPVVPWDAEEWQPLAADVAAAAGVEPFGTDDPLFAAGSRPLVVLDAPLQRNVSIAALAATAVPAQGWGSLGQPWGGAGNALFDAAILCPVPAEWQPGDTLPATRLRAARRNGSAPSAGDVRGWSAARHLEVEGAFNLHAIEETAWSVMLGRGLRGWRDANDLPLDLGNPHFVLPQSAQFAVAGGWGGVRELSAVEVRMLARETVAQLRTRGRPFGSVAEFLDAGILHEAITRAGINGAVPPERVHTAHFLSQASVVTSLAQQLAARSDTFVVRAWGEALNPALPDGVRGRSRGRAWCEAVVQRTAALAEGDDSVEAEMGDAAGLGRRFRVVSFRWLGPDDR